MQKPPKAVTVKTPLPLALRTRRRLMLDGGRVLELELFWTTAAYWRIYGHTLGIGWCLWPIGPFVVAYRARG